MDAEDEHAGMMPPKALHRTANLRLDCALESVVFLGPLVAVGELGR